MVSVKYSLQNQNVCFQLSAAESIPKNTSKVFTQSLDAKLGANLHMTSQQSATKYKGSVYACLYYISVFNVRFYEHTLKGLKTIHFGKKRKAVCSTVNVYKKRQDSISLLFLPRLILPSLS